MSADETERRDKMESYVLFAIAEVGEAIGDVETAIEHASGAEWWRLCRTEAALLEAAKHLDTIYPKSSGAGESVRVLRQP